MGESTTWVAKNKNSATIEDFNQLLAQGSYIGGKGEFVVSNDFPGSDAHIQYSLSKPFKGWHYITFRDGYIVISDGEQLNRTYQHRLACQLEAISGSQADFIGQHCSIDDHIEEQIDKEGFYNQTKEVFINVLAQLRRKLPAEEALIFDSFSKTINHWIFDSSAEIEDSELSEQFEKSKMLFSEDSPVSPIFEDAINAIQAMYWQQKHQRLTEILHLLDEAK